MAHFTNGDLITAGGTSPAYIHLNRSGILVDTHPLGLDFTGKTPQVNNGSTIILPDTEQIWAMDFDTAELTLFRAQELVFGAFREFSPMSQCGGDFVTLMRANDSSASPHDVIWVVDQHNTVLYESPDLALTPITVVNSDVIAIPPALTAFLYSIDTEIYHVDKDSGVETLWFTDPGRRLQWMDITGDGSTVYAVSNPSATGASRIHKLDSATATVLATYTVSAAPTTILNGLVLSVDEAYLWSVRRASTNNQIRVEIATGTVTISTNPAFGTPGAYRIGAVRAPAGGGRPRMYTTMLG